MNLRVYCGYSALLQLFGIVLSLFLESIQYKRAIVFWSGVAWCFPLSILCFIPNSLSLLHTQFFWRVFLSLLFYHSPFHIHPFSYLYCFSFFNNHVELRRVLVQVHVVTRPTRCRMFRAKWMLSLCWIMWANALLAQNRHCMFFFLESLLAQLFFLLSS